MLSFLLLLLTKRYYCCCADVDVVIRDPSKIQDRTETETAASNCSPTSTWNSRTSHHYCQSCEYCNDCVARGTGYFEGGKGKREG